MSAPTFAAECRTALAAAACAVHAVRRAGTDCIRKDDASPATAADFAAQALICAALRDAFPHDAVLAEEDAAVLRRHPQLLHRVWRAVADTHRFASADALLAALDHGRCAAARQWVVDPVDGTAGFLRGGQYAVCLALLVDAQPVVGVLACPNWAAGTVVYAVRGHGAFRLPLAALDEALLRGDVCGTRLQMAACRRIRDARLCQSVAHPSHTQAQAAAALGIVPAVRIDSQVKYALLACGDCDIYLRLAADHRYREKTWDHAAGALIVAEAGGTVSDAEGRPLAYGTTLQTYGVVAAAAPLHAAVVRAVRAVVHGRRSGLCTGCYCGYGPSAADLDEELRQIGGEDGVEGDDMDDGGLDGGEEAVAVAGAGEVAEDEGGGEGDADGVAAVVDGSGLCVYGEEVGGAGGGGFVGDVGSEMGEDEEAVLLAGRREAGAARPPADEGRCRGGEEADLGEVVVDEVAEELVWAGELGGTGGGVGVGGGGPAAGDIALAADGDGDLAGADASDDEGLSVGGVEDEGLGVGECAAGDLDEVGGGEEGSAGGDEGGESCLV
ncbi:hypothetical protein PMAC_002093 [Pneumocystis sp. 'macacae']|nr:hypothetical protein PMAC_002093 [Pneumocystis sp. 'macacae']